MGRFIEGDLVLTDTQKIIIGSTTVLSGDKKASFEELTLENGVPADEISNISATDSTSALLTAAAIHELNNIAGTSGSSGTSGAAGTSGSSGTSGIAGTSGSSGTSGVAGTSGSSGTSGATGAAGTSGSSGTSGTSALVLFGTSGTSGTSAYADGTLFLVYTP